MPPAADQRPLTDGPAGAGGIREWLDAGSTRQMVVQLARYWADLKDRLLQSRGV